MAIDERKPPLTKITFTNFYQIKEVERFLFRPGAFSEIFINDSYIIINSKIFYLYRDEPYPSGVLEWESLLDFSENEEINNETNRFMSGPVIL